ncbi:retrovirus-related pol polyprotein from transposon TNT 1-94 [Tanacetum coccineum]
MKKLQWKSPYEVLDKKPQVFDHLRVIGCLSYAAVTRPHKDKDVLFDEKVFPFKDTTPTRSKRMFNMPCFADEPFEDELSPLANTPLPSDFNTSTPIIHNSYVSNTPDLTTHDPPDPNISTQIPSAIVPNDNGPTQSKRANAVSTVQYPLFGASVFKGIPHSHIAFLANAFAATDPTSFHQAKTYDGWIEAMNKELAALEAKETWTLTYLPSGHTTISSKWVYKTKFKPDGSEERKKARLVVRGFNQKEGLDYKHTFSPVAKLATVRVVIALATAKQWPLH